LNSRSNGVATGGTIHAIDTAPIRMSEERFYCQLNPGLEFDWENGYWDPDTRRWYRRDHMPIEPTQWSPLPGEEHALVEPPGRPPGEESEISA